MICKKGRAFAASGKCASRGRETAECQSRAVAGPRLCRDSLSETKPEATGGDKRRAFALAVRERTVRWLGSGVAYARQRPDRQPRRDRLPDHPDARGGSGCAPSRSIPRPTRTRCFVAMADEAHRIGPAPARESYLAIEQIIAVAQAAARRRSIRATASCRRARSSPRPARRAGIVFVGPPATAIRAMGLKDAAKALMQQAGVPVVPGYHGDQQEPDFLRQKADEIGYPVLIKAVAGGGGKGMRRVEKAGDFEAALESAQREARAPSAMPRVLVEKYVTAPRHIEIQVFADAPRQRRASLRARLLAAAPASEGDRGGAGAGHAAGDARRDGARGGRGGAGGRLCRRRHGRVHRRRPRGRCGPTASASWR